MWAVAERLGRRISNLSAPAGGRLKALSLMIKMSHRPMDAFEVRYEGKPLKFRRIDEAALNEVLFQRQYEFLAPLVRRFSAPSVLDVGANIGTFSVWLSSIVSDANVLAVEASKSAATIARHNLERLNGRYEVMHRAASDSDGMALLLHESEDSVGHRISTSGTAPVESVSLRSLINQIAGEDGIVDVAKVDIEGSEELFLLCDTDQLKRIRVLVVELHPDACDAGRVEKALRGAFQSVVNVLENTGAKPLFLCH